MYCETRRTKVSVLLRLSERVESVDHLRKNLRERRLRRNRQQTVGNTSPLCGKDDPEAPGSGGTRLSEVRYASGIQRILYADVLYRMSALLLLLLPARSQHQSRTEVQALRSDLRYRSSPDSTFFNKPIAGRRQPRFKPETFRHLMLTA